MMSPATDHPAAGPVGPALRVIHWIERVPTLIGGWLAALWEFGLRIAIAVVFFRAGETKVVSDGWWDLGSWWSITDITVMLFKEEYRVPLLSPGFAAYLATTVEHVAPVLLILGLGARLGAAGLLAMTAVIQFFVYPGTWHVHLLWAVLLAYVVVRGPGKLSIDHLIRRSFAKG